MVYRGLVRNGVVVLETGVTFPDGTVVEVQAADETARVAILGQTRIGLPDAVHMDTYEQLMSNVHKTRDSLLAQSLPDPVL